MITEKKNQHYIPKFYLRNFSCHQNLKQIGIFHTQSDFYFSHSKLKTQGSKNFFYGYDGKIEEWLSEIEGHLSQLIRHILSTEKLPIKNRIDHKWLLAFVGLTHLRNPVNIQGIIDSQEQMKRRMRELAPDANLESFERTMSHHQAVELALSNVMHIVDNIVDLDYKLVINRTSTPFITSDYPIIKYNRFLEDRKWKHGKTGFGSKGLKIFVPINPKTSIIFYDPKIYRVGDKKKTILNLTRISDIDQLNTLQLLNCLNTVFFNEEISEHYIRSLHANSKQYSKANNAVSRVGKYRRINEEPDENEHLIIVGKTDLEIKLEIQGIRNLSSSGYIKLDNRVAQLRDHPFNLRRNKR